MIACKHFLLTYLIIPAKQELRIHDLLPPQGGSRTPSADFISLLNKICMTCVESRVYSELTVNQCHLVKV